MCQYCEDLDGFKPTGTEPGTMTEEAMAACYLAAVAEDANRTAEAAVMNLAGRDKVSMIRSIRVRQAENAEHVPDPLAVIREYLASQGINADVLAFRRSDLPDDPEALRNLVAEKLDQREGNGPQPMTGQYL